MTEFHRSLPFAMLLTLLASLWANGACAAQFEKSPCWFPIPADREMSCGHLLVPESRAKPSSTTISLAVVIFEPDRTRHHPVVFLSGGPGQPAGIGTEDEIQDWWNFINDQDWLRGRQLVVFDQRGVGLSRPALDCSSLVPRKGNSPRLSASGPALREATRAAALSCRNSLIERRIDPGAYNTWESAEDVEDLRGALGFDKWILYGVSYGTEVAMAVLKRHPAGESAAILDSVLPLGTNYLADDGVNLARAISILDSDCSADPDCHDGAPSLAEMVKEDVARLNASPVPLWLAGKDKGPSVVRLSGDDYLEFLFNAFYDSAMLPVLPALVRKTYDQDYRLLAPLLATKGGDQQDEIADGLDYSVTCAEAGNMDADAATPDYMRRWAADTDYSLVCPLWLGAREPQPYAPPASIDVPVLFLSGEYDPATPAPWAQAAARAFPAGQSIVFRGIGHDVIDSDSCGSEVVADFLRHPEAPVRSPCLADLKAPNFIAVDDDLWKGRSAIAFAELEEHAVTKRARNFPRR